MVCSIGKLYAKVNDYAQDNYYTKDAGLENSQWYGNGAKILGLEGQVLTEDYNRAYHGINNKGFPLRQRQSGKKANPGRDITLSAPKSVSLLGLVKEDKQVIEAHQTAVKHTLEYIEQNCIFTRTGKGGANRQQTDNVMVAIFQHDDNRNQDPQLHSHCVIFNQTRGEDSKWRAMDNRELYQQKMTIGMVYHHELGRELKKLGYELTWNRDGTFEVYGYTPEQIKAFSTRRQEIESAVGKDASAAKKARACTSTRRGKVHQAVEEREGIKKLWREKAESNRINHPQPKYGNRKQLLNLQNQQELLTEAITVTSEKQVAFPRHILFKELLRQSQGNFNLKDLQRELNNNQSLIKTNDGRLTTLTAIKREKQIIHLAQSGMNIHHHLASTETAQKQAKQFKLNKAQTDALINFVTNKDSVILCQGDAGVGKTYTVKALKKTIYHNISMRGLAPSAAAATQLQQGTDIPCQTLDAYLNIPIKSLTKNELIVVDEAGMISSSQMKNLLERVKQTNSRILLIGDTKQLAAVQAGFPFKLLQEQTKLPTIQIDENVRQQNINLKQVVDLLAAGEIERGYQKLQANDSIKQMPIDSLRRDAVVTDYLQRDEKTRLQTLVLAGTNVEKEAITNQIRQGLIQQEKLGQNSQQIPILKSKDLDRFSLTQASNYQIGDVIKFRRNSAKFSQELYYRVDEVDLKKGIVKLRDRYDSTEILELNRYKDREVFQSQTRELRSGEQMKFTRNQYQNKQKQINGQHFTVIGFKDNGQIVIKTKGKTQSITPDSLLYSDYRYGDTVHSSQGKTANYCIYAAGSGNSLTVGKESFYVAASRARQEFTVYTASSKALGVSVNKSRGQENALPLITTQKPSRNSEFKLLVAAKYLVEHQGKFNLQNPQEKTYQSLDGTEIRRNKNYLTIKQQEKELKFNRDNTTVNNTFSATQINYQIQARTNEMQQHLQLNKAKTQNRSISR
ncbi:Conjugative relaxase domain protein [Hyella patelloides LEGE 07179]|uniref:Conjugative relaxase domain protein n=1 Tax=Hyella patelloides LEGE 07179 TaxID=945734 RepID=A0A563VT51_9CYAN|nr:MobF family relaxase [Hyella patelloides]VEP14646.1 Conjugative relaxase domain protein [Hyella patelloides LEGE 07179]VEP14655.1 Conjugative relaxase domain protein [Hyella patelloides LEGE 07179]